MKKLVDWGIILAMYLIAASILYAGWLAFSPVNIIEFNPPVIQVLNPQVHQGEDLLLEYHYKSYKNLPGHVVKTLFNLDENLFIPVKIEHEAPIIPIGEGKFVGRISIPSFAPEGNYKAIIVATYQVNSLRTQDIQIESQPFKIIK